MEEPPLIRHESNLVRNLEDITEWAARELSRIQDEVLVGLEDTICISAYDPQPSRASESNIHGGILQLVNAGAVSSGASLTITQGCGKMFFVVNTAAVSTGNLVVKGNVVDRNTGVTSSGTNTITVSGVTTDASTTDANGNPVHSFARAYLTSSWFCGSCTASSAVLDIQDIDVWHVSFEQFNDSPDLWLTTFDVNLYATATSGKFDAYLYALIKNESEIEITAAASINLGTPIANRYYRLRRGGIDVSMDGTKDGVFVDAHYANTPANIEDVSIKVWAAREL